MRPLLRAYRFNMDDSYTCGPHCNCSFCQEFNGWLKRQENEPRPRSLEYERLARRWKEEQERFDRYYDKPIIPRVRFWKRPLPRISEKIDLDRVWNKKLGPHQKQFDLTGSVVRFREYPIGDRSGVMEKCIGPHRICDMLFYAGKMQVFHASPHFPKYDMAHKYVSFLDGGEPSEDAGVRACSEVVDLNAGVRACSEVVDLTGQKAKTKPTWP